jgi:hypothetical protein
MRLFRTADPFGSGGIWTLGGVHFDLQIPGTTTHQAIDWELVQQVVTYDLIRSGLVDPNVQQSQPITQTPSWRTIPAVIYNGMPDDLKMLLGYPAGNIDHDFPIPNDGRASILHVLAPAPPVSGATSLSFRVDFGQLIPKPICSDGPYDYVYVTGPVDFQKSVEVSPTGQYRYVSTYFGTLTVTPWDIEHGQPAGDPYSAEVSGRQSGRTRGGDWLVVMTDTRLAREPSGAEIVVTWLKNSTDQRNAYQVLERCLAPAM